MRSRAFGRVGFSGWLVLGVVAYACGGDVNDTRSSGESHFLDYCAASCEDGLDCIAGVCTRGCLVGSGSCEELAPGANCTDQSIEPGDVAVCDVECDSDGDCSALGTGRHCVDGYCRGGEPVPRGTGGAPPTDTGGRGGVAGGLGASGANPSGAAGAGPGGSGGASNGGASGGAAGGAAPVAECFPAHEYFAVQGEQTLNCAACACDGAEPECTDVDCDAGIPVYPCDDERPPAESDFDVDSFLIDGDTLTIEVSHLGGCEQRYTGLCFEGFLESSPVQTSLRFEHRLIRNGICDLRYERPIRFQLGALRDAYLEAYGGESGVIDTNFGPYGFGELECRERVDLANAQISSVVEGLDASCQTDSDCVNVSIDTACHRACGWNVSRSSEAALALAVAKIDQSVCTPYTAAGCPSPFAPPCVPPMPRCLDGLCQ